MLEKLKSIASIVIIPSIALYITGFLCIEAHLARFGIVNFDIVNARFIIAGLLASLFLAVAFALSLAVTHNTRYIIEEFTIKRTLMGFVRIIGIVLITSLVIKYFFDLGISKENSQDFLSMDRYGRFDIGWVVVALISLKDSDINFVMSWTIRVIFVTIVIIILCYFANYLFIVLRKMRNVDRSADSVLQISSQRSAAVSPRKTYPRAEYWVKILICVSFICFFLTVFVWSFFKIKNSVFDYRSLNGDLGLPEKYIFCWLVLSTVFFVAGQGYVSSYPKRPSNQLSFDLFKHWSWQIYVPNLIQQVIAPMLIRILSFGAAIYPRIPISMGGGQPQEIEVRSRMNPDPFFGKKLFLIGENDQLLFVVDPDEVAPKSFGINKSRIEYLLTRTPKIEESTTVSGGD